MDPLWRLDEFNKQNFEKNEWERKYSERKKILREPFYHFLIP